MIEIKMWRLGPDTLLKKAGSQGSRTPNLYSGVPLGTLYWPRPSYGFRGLGLASSHIINFIPP